MTFMQYINEKPICPKIEKQKKALIYKVTLDSSS